jgi:hypothetical protein
MMTVLKFIIRKLSSIIHVRYIRWKNDWLRAGRSGDRIPVGARFLVLVKTGPGAHPTFRTMDTGSFPGVQRRGRGADHTTLLVPRSRKSRAILLPPPPSLSALWSVTEYLYFYIRWTKEQTRFNMIFADQMLRYHKVR